MPPALAADLLAVPEDKSLERRDRGADHRHQGRHGSKPTRRKGRAYEPST
jgi:hypothetical protein